MKCVNYSDLMMTYKTPTLVFNSVLRALKFNNVSVEYRKIKLLAKVGKKTFKQIIRTWLCYAEPRLTPQQIFEKADEIEHLAYSSQ